MQMIDVLKRLADLDKGNPNVVNPMVAEAAVEEEIITEGKDIKLPELPEPGLGDLKTLSGVKTKLTESTIAECGMMPMGAPMPPTMPASLNMSAGNAGEIVAMMRGIMDLAKGDVPSQSLMPTMGSPMPKMMGDLDRDGDHDMADHGLEHDLEKDDVLTGGPSVSGPTFGDDDGAVDDSGADELADMMKKIKTGQPVKITTDMPVKVTSDEPIKGTTDKLNKISGDGPAGSDDKEAEDESYDNTPKPETKGHGGGDDFANIINKVRTADMEPTPYGSGSNPMPEKKKEEALDPLAAFESKLMADYKKFVEESEQKTMSRAAKGVMKYGKDGMQALAKAGKEGKSLEKVRAKYNKYD